MGSLRLFRFYRAFALPHRLRFTHGFSFSLRCLDSWFAMPVCCPTTLPGLPRYATRTCLRFGSTHRTTATRWFWLLCVLLYTPVGLPYGFFTIHIALCLHLGSLDLCLWVQFFRLVLRGLLRYAPLLLGCWDYCTPLPALLPPCAPLQLPHCLVVPAPSAACLLRTVMPHWFYLLLLPLVSFTRFYPLAVIYFTPLLVLCIPFWLPLHTLLAPCLVLCCTLRVPCMPLVGFTGLHTTHIAHGSHTLFLHILRPLHYNSARVWRHTLDWRL